MKRRSSGLSLLVAVDKPAGMTSHDVVNRCRTIFSESRVGHMGTLDPFATGVLPVCIGPAARLDAYAGDVPKRYRARIVFGTATDTDDATGRVIATAPVPNDVCEREFAQGVLARFTGEISQVPPAYSAIKRNGVKAYEAARKGQSIELEPRVITVHGAALVGIDAGADGDIAWTVDFEVSKGTYIRSLARDIGEACGTAAHLGTLQRTSVGKLVLDDCVTLDELAQRGADAAANPFDILAMESVEITPHQAEAASHGNPVDLPDTASTEPGTLIALISENAIAAIYRHTGNGRCVADCVFSIPVRLP